MQQERNDADLPLRGFSLDRFIKKAKGIRMQNVSDDRDEMLARWMEFGIAGINTNGGYRASIDVERHYINEEWVDMEKQQLKFRHDFDSLMGRSKELPYTVAIEVYPLFASGFRILKSLHIGPVSLNDHHGKSIEEFHIPHVVLGHASERRSTIRLMIPGLINWNNLRERSIPPNILAELYNDCVYPAAVSAVHPGEAGHWLSTYQAEMTRARGPRGHLQSSGRLIPKDQVVPFGRKLLEKLHAKPWGKAAYYFHELRGTRGATQHEWKDHSAKLDAFLGLLQLEIIDKRQWWIDVGTEIQCPGYVLWWRRDAHEGIIQEALDISKITASMIMKQKPVYHVDEACQLNDFAGFRIKVPGVHRQRTGVAYIQAYNTEKEAVYRVTADGNTITLPYKEVLLKSQFKIQSHTDRLANIWKSIRRKADGHARLEMRINLAMYDPSKAYVNLDQDTICHQVCEISRHVWWDFKLLRLTAMAQAIRWWQEAKQGRSNPLSLALMVSLVFMINGLSSRSVDLPAEQAIQETILKDTSEMTYQVDIDGEEYEAGKRNPLRIIFPSSVIIDPNPKKAPQLGPGLRMPVGVWNRLFDQRNLLGMQLAAENPDIQVGVKPAAEIQERFRKPRNRLNIRHKGPTRAEDEIEVPANVLVFEETDPDPTLQVEVATATDELSQMVTNLVARAYMDMLLCAPKGKGNNIPSYCRLSDKEIRDATSLTFQEPNLANIWHRCIVKPGDDDSWELTFSYLFPAQIRTRPRAGWQNYENCAFWMKWREIIGALSYESALEIQALVRVQWNRILWMPWARSDRIWMTTSLSSSKIGTKDRSSCVTYPYDHKGPAPYLITNPNWQGEAIYFDAEIED